MVEGRARSQTCNLTLDHKKLGTNPIRCVQVKCNTPLESFWRELQVCFRPHPNPSYESWEFKSGQFRDSSLGVPGIKAIWMRVWRSNTENTIWGKVMASPESGPWWVKWARVARGLSQHQGCFWRWINQLTVGFDAGPSN